MAGKSEAAKATAESEELEKLKREHDARQPAAAP